jgi:hypothetical protein
MEGMKNVIKPHPQRNCKIQWKGRKHGRNVKRKGE